MVVVDTNVLVDVLEDDPIWAEWSIGKLRALSRVHELVINPVIYAELSAVFASIEDLESAVTELQLKFLDLPRAALFLAGKAFVRYRGRAGTKTNVLPDFFIGAHAAVLDCAVITRDPRRYRNYFRSIEIIAPS